MLFPPRFVSGLIDGSVTVAFRRWTRPSVKAAGTLLSPAGRLSIDEVTPIEESDITEEDARAAGYQDAAAVVASLRPTGTLYRIRFHRIGEDPRVALRNVVEIGDEELDELRRALRRLPWAESTMRLIEERPEVVSTELAAAEGVERPVFKRRVRQLKALGLTESLDVGYRLSPRGRRVLDAVFGDS